MAYWQSGSMSATAAQDLLEGLSGGVSSHLRSLHRLGATGHFAYWRTGKLTLCTGPPM